MIGAGTNGGKTQALHARIHIAAKNCKTARLPCSGRAAVESATYAGTVVHALSDIGYGCLLRALIQDYEESQ